MKKLVIVILVVLVFQKWEAISTVISPAQTNALASNKEVILYATSWCGYCAKTRKLLDEHNVDYFEYDVEKSAEGKAQRKQLGGNGVPVIVINGEVLKGYNRAKILKTLNKET